MSPALQEVRQTLDALGAAVRLRDAPAIISASEALATSVSRTRQATLQRGGDSRDSVALSELLAELETLGIEVNMHTAWTRQRIDKLAEFRGQTHLVAARYS